MKLRHVAALALPILLTFAAARTASLEASGIDSGSALTSGYRLAFAIGAGLVVAAAIVATTLLRGPGSAPQRSQITDAVTRHIRG